MKKILLLWALIMPFVFSSCDDDKDEVLVMTTKMSQRIQVKN